LNLNILGHGPVQDSIEYDHAFFGRDEYSKFLENLNKVSCTSFFRFFSFYFLTELFIVIGFMVGVNRSETFIHENCNHSTFLKYTLILDIFKFAQEPRRLNTRMEEQTENPHD
jgi:hypothetical protein